MKKTRKKHRKHKTKPKLHLTRRPSKKVICGTSIKSHSGYGYLFNKFGV